MAHSAVSEMATGSSLIVPVLSSPSCFLLPRPVPLLFLCRARVWGSFYSSVSLGITDLHEQTTGGFHQLWGFLTRGLTSWTHFWLFFHPVSWRAGGLQDCLPLSLPALVGFLSHTLSGPALTSPFLAFASTFPKLMFTFFFYVLNWRIYLSGCFLVVLWIIILLVFKFLLLLTNLLGDFTASSFLILQRLVYL